MKAHLFLAAIAVFATTPAFAAPLLVTSSSNGYVPQSHIRFERCLVYDNRVVIEKRIGFENGAPIVVEQTLPAKVSANVTTAIAKAVREVVFQKPNDMCDGPSSMFTAQSPVMAQAIIVDSTGGCGTPARHREGTASSALREIAISYCGSISALAPQPSQTPKPTQPTEN